jgi:hypothetical protein
MLMASSFNGQRRGNGRIVYFGTLSGGCRLRKKARFPGPLDRRLQPQLNNNHSGNGPH